jgi:hypothetical protein
VQSYKNVTPKKPFAKRRTYGAHINDSPEIAMKVYEWEALSNKRQEQLLEKYRDPCDYGWWDFVYEGFREQCADIGIQVDDITFSGFWSQGDGAAFEGRVTEWAPVLFRLGRPHWLNWAVENTWTFYSATGRSNCMSFGCDMPMLDNPYDEDEEPLQHSAWLIKHQPPSERELEQLESDLQGLFNDLADDLYKHLEEEYEYLTSDETTLEYILDNVEIHELDLDEDEIEAVQEARDDTPPVDERQLALF